MLPEDLDGIVAQPEVTNEFLESGKAKRSKRTVSETSEVQVKRRQRNEYTWDMKFGAALRGCLCTACGKTDRSQDPVEPGRTRLWARYVPCTSGIQGLHTVPDGLLNDSLD